MPTAASKPRTLAQFPAWAVVVAAFAILGVVLWQKALNVSDGVIGYAQDDAYIHLAIAKNFAFHGVWGVTPWESVSASSSPVWTLLLALGMRMVGNHVWIALWMNVLAGIALIYATDRVLRRPWPWAPVRVVVSFAVLMAVPLATLVAVGMEHTLQAALTAALFGFLRAGFGSAGALQGKRLVGLFWLVATVCLVRFECAALLIVPLIYFVARRNWRVCSAVGGGVILAVASWALFSASQHMSFEPNSIALKRSAWGPQDGNVFAYYWDLFATNLTRYPHVAALLMALFVMMWVLVLTKKQPATVLLAATGMTAIVLHALFAKFGLFYRYEAYLVLFGLLTIATAVGESIRSREDPAFLKAAFVVLAVLSVALPPASKDVYNHTSLWNRSMLATGLTPIALDNIGHQHVQMGKFIAAYYPTSSVLVNDIGAVCYYAEPHVLDFIGLGTDEVAVLKKHDEFTAAKLQAMIRARHIDMGIIYPGWLPGVPDDSILVAGVWDIRNNVAAAAAQVMFVADTPEKAEALLANLKAFQSELPTSVQFTTPPDNRPTPLVRFVRK